MQMNQMDAVGAVLLNTGSSAQALPRSLDFCHETTKFEEYKGVLWIIFELTKQANVLF